jgi:opacity protein-like surface antigen
MKLLNKIIIVLLFLLGAVSVFAAPSLTGTSGPADLSKVAFSARQHGMGGAGIALADDTGGFILNPAGLAGVKEKEFSSMSSRFADSFDYLWLGYIHPAKADVDTFGVSFFTENFGSLSRTGLDPNGRETSIGSFGAGDFMGTFSYGRRLSKELYSGLQLRYTSKQIDDATGSSFDLDAGSIYRVNQNLKLGATYRNLLGTGFSYNTTDTTASHTPGYLAVGAAWELVDKSLTFAADYSFSQINRLQLGAEYWLNQSLAARGGWNQGTPSLGVGLRYGNFQVDYAMLFNDESLGNSAFISITFGNARLSELSAPEIQIDAAPQQTVQPVVQPTLAEPAASVNPEAPVSRPVIEVQ